MARKASDPETGPKSAAEPDPAAQLNPYHHLPRVKQVQWDHYYMSVAKTVRTRANCYGALVGAVLVRENRIISTGFNGTPAGFPNCTDGGCVRCRERELADQGLEAEIKVPDLASGPKQLDLCVCVHAEANAILSAARFGNITEHSTLYSTHKPCFACLKEAVQAGVGRIVFLKDWIPDKRDLLLRQYALLEEHLRQNESRNFEQLARQSELIGGTALEPRDPCLDAEIEVVAVAAEPAQSPSETAATSKTVKK